LLLQTKFVTELTTLGEEAWAAADRAVAVSQVVEWVQLAANGLGGDAKGLI
jgi:hypothetical protein